MMEARWLPKVRPLLEAHFDQLFPVSIHKTKTFSIRLQQTKVFLKRHQDISPPCLQGPHIEEEHDLFLFLPVSKPNQTISTAL